MSPVAVWNIGGPKDQSYKEVGWVGVGLFFFPAPPSMLKSSYILSVCFFAIRTKSTQVLLDQLFPFFPRALFSHPVEIFGVGR